MVLGKVYLNAASAPVHISVTEGKIAGISENIFSDDTFQLTFTNALAIPGLINSHDHLDFNCFTPLGEQVYLNYTAWGKHIHREFQEQIQSVLKIPASLRTGWGIYKNLIAGVTTVVNHGPPLEIENPLIDVCQNTQNLHSVEFEKNWRWKLNNPLHQKQLLVIHTGEGVDEPAQKEIDDLIRANYLKRKLIGIHGVAMNTRQARHFAGLVWCPESNQLLLKKQPNIPELKKQVPIVFGTDSTLTGHWNIWHHLRFASGLGLVSDQELMDMTGKTPARLWGLNTGELKTGKDADIVVIRNRNTKKTEPFAFNPEDILMVLQKGNIRMVDETIMQELARHDCHLPDFSGILMNGSRKYLQGDIPALVRSVAVHNQSFQFPFECFSHLKTGMHA